MKRQSLIFSVTLSFVSILMVGLTIKNILLNPMASRRVLLDTEIENLEIRPLFYIAPAAIDYAELDSHLKSHPKLWQELVPPAKRAAPVAKGPDFKTILKGVIPSIRKEMKQGETIKVHVITPSKPRGYWAKVGDVINGTKIVQITPTHIVVEKRQRKKPYTYEHPRQ